MLSQRKKTTPQLSSAEVAVYFQNMEEKYWRTKALLENKRTPAETPYVTSSTDHSLDVIPEAAVPRVYIERDYSEVLHPRFKVDMPEELEQMRIDPRIFARTIKEINLILDAASAKATRRTAYETIMSFLTCYIVNIYRKSHYERCMDRLREYIEYQNTAEYHRRGLKIMDPTVDGMRYLKFVILDQLELIATFSEDMMGQRLIAPPPVERRKKSDTKKLLNRAVSHLKTVTIMPSSPQPGTSASFGIPRILPKNEPPPGRNASYGVHSMRYVVPFKPQNGPSQEKSGVTAEHANKAVLELGSSNTAAADTMTGNPTRGPIKAHRSRHILMSTMESDTQVRASQPLPPLDHPVQQGTTFGAINSDDNVISTVQVHYPPRYRRSRHILLSPTTESQATGPSRLHYNRPAELLPPQPIISTTAMVEKEDPILALNIPLRQLNPNRFLRDYFARLRTQRRNRRP